MSIRVIVVEVKQHVPFEALVQGRLKLPPAPPSEEK
jgi:hypothetical protein